MPALSIGCQKQRESGLCIFVRNGVMHLLRFHVVALAQQRSSSSLPISLPHLAFFLSSLHTHKLHTRFSGPATFPRQKTTFTRLFFASQMRANNASFETIQTTFEAVNTPLRRGINDL